MYTSVDSVRKNVVKFTAEIEKAEKILADNTKQLVELRSKLMLQFVDFVIKNQDIYDADFVDMLKIGFNVLEIELSNPKCAFRVTIKAANQSIKYVMIPYLFITSPQDYRQSRVLKKQLGNGITIKDVEKHFDGAIEKLAKEIENLKSQREVIIKSNGMWM